MKKSCILLSSIVLIGAGILIYSCKKKETPVPTPPQLDQKASQFNDDESRYKTESDNVNTDMNNAIKDMSIGKNNQFEGTQVLPCGATIDSSQISQKILYFNFDGVTPCLTPSCTRSGQIKAQLTKGTHWRDAGSVLTFTFKDFKIVRLSDKKSIMFNGVKTLKDVNGNNWLGYVFGTATLKYQERALGMRVKFDNGDSATWNSARVIEYSYVPSTDITTITGSGDTTVNSYSGTEAWGTNRFGTAFTSSFTTPFVANTYCWINRPINGELVHHLGSDQYTITLGVNEQGNHDTRQCAYGYKVSWNAGGKTGSVIKSY